MKETIDMLTSTRIKLFCFVKDTVKRTKDKLLAKNKTKQKKDLL